MSKDSDTVILLKPALLFRCLSYTVAVLPGPNFFMFIPNLPKSNITLSHFRRELVLAFLFLSSESNKLGTIFSQAKKACW
jgi:hypothetical protein